MVAMWRVVAAAAVVLVTFGCDGREPTNPFDTDNPDTGGSPDWLFAIAGDGVVDLGWQMAPARGFQSYELERSNDDGAIFTRVARIRSPAEIDYRDPFVTNGVTYTYRLSVISTEADTAVLPSKVAGPGSVWPWVIENSGIGLVRTSPDARHIRTRSGSFRPIFDADPADSGRVWTADYAGDRVVRYSESGIEESEWNVSTPYRVAYDPIRERLWVGSWLVGAESAELLAFNADGDIEDRVDLFGEIRDLEVDPETGACLGARGRSGGVFRHLPGGTLELALEHGEYMMLEVVDGSAAVVGDPFTNRLVRFQSTTLAALDSLSLPASPLTIHAAPNALWAAVSGNDLVAYDAGFGEVGRVSSPGDATSLAFDRESRSLWVAQPTRGRVSRLSLDTPAGDSPNGRERVDLSLFNPFLVVLGSR